MWKAWNVVASLYYYVQYSAGWEHIDRGGKQEVTSGQGVGPEDDKLIKYINKYSNIFSVKVSEGRECSRKIILKLKVFFYFLQNIIFAL